MDYWRREQWGTAAGIASVGLFTAGALMLNNFPGVDAPSDAIASFFVSHRSTLLVQSIFDGLGITAALWFLGTLRGVLRRAEGGTGRVAGIAYGGGVAAVAMVLVIGILQVAATSGAKVNDVVVTAGMYRASQVALGLLAYPLTVLLAASALVAIRTGILPRVLAFATVVPIGLCALGPISLFQESGQLAPGGSLAFFGPFGGTMAWILATSVILTIKLAHPVETAVARRRISDITNEPPMAQRG